ncbi:MAG: TonB-dependent receptor [Gammaproteobacteria bacterium]|jgi:outer membrane receptor protein involved in Fe transport|nr:TonB-dependent receptor [Gammaproteobacteria bacterium]MDH3749173.1 TonB-dependent receptor [Gammaproteobacteria bacterium]
MSRQSSRASGHVDIRMKSVSIGVRKALLNKRAAPLMATTLLASAMAFGQGNEPLTLDEVIVTAQKRAQSLQEVPISITVLNGELLADLGVKSFDDYVRLMSNVSFSGRGPSQAQIYMRGCSDGGDGNLSGTNPSSSVYFDEQPVTSIFRNLNPHVYDIDHIEALGGPQGTLYGASSQCGTVRIVTNKPDTSGFEAGYDVSGTSTSGGETGYSVEGFVNAPLSDRAAIRLVGWYVEEGGWIDNVPGTISFPTDPNASININGNPNYFHSGIGEAGVGSPLGSLSNTGNSDSALNTVADDTNDVTTQGLRAALGIDLNDSWTLEVGVNVQKQEVDGLFSDQPDTVGEGNVVRFYQDRNDDEYTQLAATLEGDIGDWGKLTLAGSYLDRDVNYDIDYSSYAAYSSYVELYYTCDYYAYYYNPGFVSYLSDAAQQTCRDPRIQYEQESNYKRSTVEARLQSQGDGRLNWIAGLFYNDDDHDYFNQWHIPTVDLNSGNGNAIPTDRNIQGETDLYFVTNQNRQFTETAFFGEISYDFSDKFTGLVGARFFETEDEATGFVGTRFSCFDPATGNRLGGPTATGACGAGLKVDDSDSTLKVNLTYQFNDDFMGYFTFSQGFRPSGINREGTTNIPQIYGSDTVDNIEVGWKATLADGRVRFNGAVYLMEWSDIQLTRFDPAESFLGLTSNAGDAEMIGIEVTIDWLINDNWDLAFSASLNEAELTEDFAKDTSGSPVDAPDGTDLPFTPDLKYSVSTRYTWDDSSLRPFIQAAWSFTDDSWNDLFLADRDKQDSYGLLSARFGIQKENWVLELYGDNLTDEHPEIFKYTRAGDNRVITSRPVNYGVRFRQRFD